MRLKRVDIRQHWTRIKPQLEEVLEKFNGIPEEVYAACRGSLAHLFVTEDETGWVVLKEYPDPDNGQKILFVWAGYQENNGNSGISYLEDVKQIGKEIGAEVVRFRTNRKGFERVLGPEWEVGHIEYESRIINV